MLKQILISIAILAITGAMTAFSATQHQREIAETNKRYERLEAEAYREDHKKVDAVVKAFRDQPDNPSK